MRDRKFIMADDDDDMDDDWAFEDDDEEEEDPGAPGWAPGPGGGGGGGQRMAAPGPTGPNGQYNPFIDPKVGTGFSGWAPAGTPTGNPGPNGNPDPFAGGAPAAPKAPKDNQGRDKCFWCGAPTKKVPGLMMTYDVCTKCGK